MVASFWNQNLWLPTLALAAIVGLYYYYESKRRYWAKLGLTGIIPFPIVGQFYTLLMVDKLEMLKYGLKTHGKVYGIHMSGKARILIADPEVLRQICIKDFDKFQNHEVNIWSNKFQRKFLVWLQDDQWKRVRSLISPSFTSSKIKRMFKFLDGCADDLLAIFNDHLLNNGSGKDLKGSKGVVVNLKEIFDLFTMDGIATCCFGLKLKRQTDSLNLKTSATRDDFLKSVLKLFAMNYWRFLLIFVIPRSILVRVGFKLSTEESFQPLAQRLEKLIEKRHRDPKKYDDLLQSLIEAREGDQMETGDMDQKENHHASLTQESLIADQKRMAIKGKQVDGTRLQLSQLEIISEAMIMISAGFETTSGLLTNCCYSLAFHPKVQERLYNELSKIAQYDPSEHSYRFEYDSLTSCNYLDSVISETLRILPPALITDRVAKEDYFIEKYKVHIPKGSSLLLGLYTVQNDPDNWYKPEKFDPDRFMPGNREKIVPGSYAPFSMGPRHCVGMRFSLTESKIGLAKSVMKFKFEPAPGNKYPPISGIKPGLVSPKNPTVRVLRRSY